MLYDTKTSLKEEIKKLKKMSFKDKLWYIKEYYSIHIIGILILLFFVISMVNIALKKDPVFTSSFVNVLILEEEKQKIIDDFTTFAELDKTDDFWRLDDSFRISFSENSDPVANQQYLLKLNASISSRQLDTVITQKELIDYLLSIDGLLPLNNVLPKDFIENNSENFYIKKDIDTNNIYAINIANSPLFKELGIKENVYFAIASNSENIELSLKFLEFIYKNHQN